MKKYLKMIIPLLAGVVLWLLPTPDGLSVNAWQYFAIFIAVILGLVLEPLPAAVCGLLGVGLMAALMLVPPSPSTMTPAKPAVRVETAAQAQPGPAAAAQAKTENDPPPKNTPADQIKWALSGFADSTVWLIFAAFIFAQGYEKTGLGRRIALLLIKLRGRSTLGLGYAGARSDLCLAP